MDLLYGESRVESEEGTRELVSKFIQLIPFIHHFRKTLLTFWLQLHAFLTSLNSREAECKNLTNLLVIYCDFAKVDNS